MWSRVFNIACVLRCLSTALIYKLSRLRHSRGNATYEKPELGLANCREALMEITRAFPVCTYHRNENMTVCQVEACTKITRTPILCMSGYHSCLLTTLISLRVSLTSSSFSPYILLQGATPQFMPLQSYFKFPKRLPLSQYFNGSARTCPSTASSSTETFPSSSSALLKTQPASSAPFYLYYMYREAHCGFVSRRGRYGWRCGGGGREMVALGRNSVLMLKMELDSLEIVWKDELQRVC